MWGRKKGMTNKKICLAVKDAVRICELLASADFDDRVDDKEARQFVLAIYKEAYNLTFGGEKKE